MPEGDTLRRLADKISERFVGERVRSQIFRHPRLATAELAGSKLVSADATGKHLLCRFDDGRTLHVHLLMQGKVVFGAAADVADWKRRFEIEFESGSLTGVDIPLLHLFPTSREEEYVGHLGPDLCGAYDHAAAIARVEAAADRHLGAALLDQQIIAGFGNIYAVETPFICGVSPFTRVGKIADVGHLVSIGAALIRTNATRGPQNTTGKKLHLADQWVLPSRVRQCSLCGERLQRRSGSQTPWQRRTAWCPSCQPDTSCDIDVERAAKLLSLHPARHMLDFDSATLTADTSQAVVSKR